MSSDWVNDMYRMHIKYKVHDWVKDNPEKLEQFLKFRLDFLNEELEETWIAYRNRDAEELVDGLIDLCVIAIGTLDAFDIDAYTAWDQVFNANMEKSIGMKESRPNDLGLPDLIKGPHWESPDHSDNHGLLTQIWDEYYND